MGEGNILPKYPTVSSSRPFELRSCVVVVVVVAAAAAAAAAVAVAVAVYSTF